MAHNHVSPVKNFLAGGFGGMCLVFVGHPLDTIKVRLQVMPKASSGIAPTYSGTWDCIRKTFRQEGVRGFYKGLLSPLATITPVFALGFFGYGIGKRIIVSTQEGGGELSFTQLFLAGAFSGVLSTFLVTPVERVKCLLQVQRGQINTSVVKYASPTDCASQLLKQGGIQSLYRGFYSTIVKLIPAAGLYYSTYETLKKAATKRSGSKGLTPLHTMCIGGLTGVINWVVVIPLDVIKSRVQAAPEGTYPRGARDVFLQLAKQEGFRGFYKGMVPVMLRAFPASASLFVGYEASMKFMNWATPNL